MLKTTLLEFFERELLKLREEIALYPDERSLWETVGDINNSAGNLCLHLCGNMQHFVGAVLGHSGYVRDRDSEFARKHVPTEELIEGIDTTLRAVKTTLEGLDEAAFTAAYPVDKHGKAVTTDYMLLHLLSHFNYHLGQINYHRRLLAAS